MTMTMMTLTAPVLFALSRGESYSTGPHRCFYCSAPCGEQHESLEFVKDSFTGRDTVAGGDYVCGGCVAAMQEKIELTTVDGVKRVGQKVRGYSWVITEQCAKAATKANREYLLSVCLDPPKPPFVICLSDSGQKHLLYRAVVCHSQEAVTVTLEGERITYKPMNLHFRLQLCKQIAAAVGKPALTESLTINQQMMLAAHHRNGAAILSAWMAGPVSPLTRLAAWFCPPKEICLHEYPKYIPAPAAGNHQHRRVQKTLGGTV